MNNQTQTIKFSNDSKDFYKTLRKRVNNYFKENNISKHANANMKFKTAFMITLYLVPYFLVVTNVITSNWGIFGMFIIMAFGFSGIGLSVMHDANHGSYSKHQWVNKVLGALLNSAGGYHINWKIQHNVLHHTYTNISEHDEDIDTNPIMRFSPRQKHYKHQRFQILYFWFFYGIMTFYWVIYKDVGSLIRYKKQGLIKSQGISFKQAMFELIIYKVLYLMFILGVPMLTTDMSFGFWFLCFFSMHFVSGSILAFIFQPAHVVMETEFPEPDKEGNMENNWAIHQLYTTADFAQGSRLFSWYIGGLNYQIEHHLFPNICHVHYRKISKIVKETAEEYHLPYYTKKTFFGAVKSHVELLNRLGKGYTAA